MHNAAHETTCQLITDASSLIESFRSSPPQWVIEGLLGENEIAGLHGPQEVFKTIFCLQLQEALALGRPLWDLYKIPRPRRTLLLETEMSPIVMGRRLAAMYPSGPAPSGMLYIAEADLRALRRAVGLEKKFELLDSWVRKLKVEVLILDTCNPFFRGKESANAEEHVGKFFDLLGDLPLSVKIFVRHNHKRREMESGDDASLIRGSGQFADVPDLLMQLKRQDRRTNEATLSVSKFRHGSRPDDLTLWFDKEAFRLTPRNPVEYVLQGHGGGLTRDQLLGELHSRFGIAQRKADELVKDAKIVQTMLGHRKVFMLESDAIRE
jgi:RecA-family ATPase